MKSFEKIEHREAIIAVVGLGYVGLPLATAFAKSGFDVLGIDVDPNKVESINCGQSYISDVPSMDLSALTTPNTPTSTKAERPALNANGKPNIAAGQLTAHTEFDVVAGCDAIFICVPSPFDEYKTPDLTYILGAAEAVARHLRRGQLVVLQSTTYPGTTEEIVKPILERNGLSAGEDFHLAFSPERIDPGNQRWTAENIPKVVGGLTPACTQVAAALLAKINPEVHPVSSPRTAEMTKLLENIFRIVNIAMINELALFAERTELDIWEVIEAAATKPFGYMPFYPGPGVGGHCIPVDPYYLSWKAREYDFTTRFIDLAAEVNQRMPFHVVDLIAWALEKRDKSLRGAKLLLLGAAFKPDLDDTRNAPAVRVSELLLDREANVSYHDPYVSRFNIRPSAFYKGRQNLESVHLDDGLLAAQDCVVILVHHSCIDYEYIVQHSALVVDAVNATHDLECNDGKVIRLGVSSRTPMSADPSNESRIDRQDLSSIREGTFG